MGKEKKRCMAMWEKHSLGKRGKKSEHNTEQEMGRRSGNFALRSLL